jgi:hypothetical protein
MSYTEFRDGYAVETTPGTSAITLIGDTAYILGAVMQASEHPSPKATMRYTATGYNVKEVGANLLWKANFSCRGVYYLIMQNGIPIYLALGDSSTVGDIHTLVPFTDGSPIPSITINTEQRGSATNEEYQFMGCKVDSLTMIYDMKDAPFLMAKIEYMAMGAQDGIALTTAPALPATANTDVYTNLERKWDSGGTPVNLDGLQYLEIQIINGLRPVYGHTWDTGAYTGRWPYQLLEASRKQYKIIMDLHPNTIERALWDELIAAGSNNEMTFKWTRSATDYILVTATDCYVTQHDIITPEAGETLIERVIIEPRALSVDVSDAIADARYGD